MGGMKSHMETLESLRSIARIVLCNAGVLKQCEIHGLYFDTGVNIAAAYSLANAKITSGELYIGEAKRRDLTDQIKHEFENNCAIDGCPQCGRY